MLLFALVRSPYERKLIASAQQRKTVLGGGVREGSIRGFLEDSQCDPEIIERIMADQPKP